MEKIEIDQSDLDGPFSSNEGYIQACADAMTAIQEIDFALMEPGYKERYNLLTMKIFEIIERCITEIHEEVFIGETR